MKFRLVWPLLWLGIRAGALLTCVVIILGTTFSYQWWEISWSMVLDVMALILGGVFTWGWMREQKSLPGFLMLIEEYGKYFFGAMMSWWFTLLLVLLSLVGVTNPAPEGPEVTQGDFLQGVTEEFAESSMAFGYSMFANFWVLVRFMLMNLVIPLGYLVFGGKKVTVSKKGGSRSLARKR